MCTHTHVHAQTIRTMRKQSKMRGRLASMAARQTNTESRGRRGYIYTQGTKSRAQVQIMSNALSRQIRGTPNACMCAHATPPLAYIRDLPHYTVAASLFRGMPRKGGVSPTRSVKHTVIGARAIFRQHCHALHCSLCCTVRQCSIRTITSVSNFVRNGCM